MTPVPPTVLCIAGSPRRNGNSDRLIHAAEEGITEGGGTALRLVVSEAGIAPCRGCNACSKTGSCVVRDGMQDVYPLLDAADAILVGTPVFFATVPAVLKALYDRCQPYWARRYVLGHPIARRRPGALLLVRGGGDPFGGDCAVTTTRSVFAVLGVDLVEQLDLMGPDAPSDVEDYPDAVARAHQIGLSMVALARTGDGGGDRP